MTLSPEPLSLTEYRRAIAVRDLTDPGQGPHAMQQLVADAVSALTRAWGVRVRVHRANPVIPIEDNYDRLGYPPDGAARDARYTRYVSDRLLLRTQTSALVPDALSRLTPTDAEPDWLIVCPGVVYRRDAIDRLHSSEPHQVDVWRVRRGEPLEEKDLQRMIAEVTRALLPGLEHRAVLASHPYTLNGLQIDVRAGGAWVEIGECGLTHPRILTGAGLHHPSHSGLALGLGLDRVLMLRKGVPDIRLLRASDPRIASQMLDLSPYRPVSQMPPVARDLSLIVGASLSIETIGDRIRAALGDRAGAVELVEARAETPCEQLPAQAIARMGAKPGQKNLLLRVVLRDLERSLTHEEANQLRDEIYLALHEGERYELASIPTDREATLSR